MQGAYDCEKPALPFSAISAISMIAEVNGYSASSQNAAHLQDMS
jgi:hypothetical protein